MDHGFRSYVSVLEGISYISHDFPIKLNVIKSQFLNLIKSHEISLNPTKCPLSPILSPLNTINPIKSH